MKFEDFEAIGGKPNGKPRSHDGHLGGVRDDGLIEDYDYARDPWDEELNPTRDWAGFRIDMGTGRGFAGREG